MSPEEPTSVTRAQVQTLRRPARPLWMDRMAAVGVPVLVLGAIITYASVRSLRSDACCFGDAEPFLALGILVCVTGLELILVWMLRLGLYRTPRQVLAGIIGLPLLLGGLVGAVGATIVIGTIDQDDAVASMVGGFVVLVFLLPSIVAILIGSWLVLAARAVRR